MVCMGVRGMDARHEDDLERSQLVNPSGLDLHRLGCEAVHGHQRGQ